MHRLRIFLLWMLTAAASVRAAEYYLSPAGDDQADGLATNRAWRTLQTSVNRLGAGDTLWIRGGVYRGRVTYTNNHATAAAPITVRGYPGETPLIKGSVETSGWLPQGNGVWKLPAWNYNSQQVFVDGVLMQQLGWANDYNRANSCGCGGWLMIPHGFTCAQLAQQPGYFDPGFPVPTMPENSFYHHAATGDLYLRLPAGQDPAGHRVEVSNTVGIFFDESQAGNLHLRDLSFQHTSTLTGTAIGWPGVLVGRQGRMENCRVEWCDGFGVTLRHNASLVNCVVSRNGIAGISYGNATNTLIRGCAVTHNNYRRYTYNNAAGIKIIPNAGAVVEDCEVAWNWGAGIWFDSCLAGHPIVVRNNHVHDNTAAPYRPGDDLSLDGLGIFIEYCVNAEVYGNRVENNANKGIHIAASRQVRVHRNVITGTHGTPGGNRGLYALVVERWSPDFPIEDIDVRNNLIYDNRCDIDVLYERPNHYLVRRIASDHNLVHRTGAYGIISQTAPAIFYFVGQSVISLANWQAMSGLDPHSLVAPPQVDAGHRPLSGSPLIDAGGDPPPDALDADFRASVRDGNGDGLAAPDIGAYERVAPSNTVRFVNAASPGPAAPYTSPATAATNLADAVAAALPGDEIEIADGELALPAEVVIAKPVTLRPARGATPVLLAGGGPHRLLRLRHAGARAHGLTLRGGSAGLGGGVLVETGVVVRCRFEANRADLFGGGLYAGPGGRVEDSLFLSNQSADCGGGVWAEAGAQVIACVFQSNLATNLGGAVFLNGAVLSKAQVSGNRAREGGGVYAAGGTVLECVLTANQAVEHGGGATLGGPALLDRCRLRANTAGVSGGGVLASHAGAVVRNGLITHNLAPAAAGVDLVAGLASFCSLADNAASAGPAGGLRIGPSATAHSLIAFGNTAPADPDILLAPGGSLHHACAAAALPGTGNLGADPLFRARAAGDYRLAWNSPCVDAADPAGPPARDLDDYPRPLDGDGDGVARSDMGALESIAVRFVNAASTTPARPFNTWATAARSPSDVLPECRPGDVVLVAPGTYRLNGPVAVGQAVLLKSTAGPEQTVLDGQNAVRCLVLANPQAVVEGFTLRNGRADSGAGAYLRGAGTLRRCIVTGNQSTGDLGAQFAYTSGGFTNVCLIAQDSTLHEGGGGIVLAGGGVVENCLVYSNRAAYAAGVLAVRGGTLRHCTVAANAATVSGGGAVLEGPVRIENSICMDNTGGALSNLWVRGVGLVSRRNNLAPIPAGDDGSTDAPAQLGPAADHYRPTPLSPGLDAALSLPGLPLDLLGAPRSADGDGDGISAPDLGAVEFAPDPGALDPDGDGLSNDAEAALGTDPDRADTDNDGVPDGEEVAQRTDPLDPASWLRIAPLASVDATGVTLRWRSVQGRVYHLYRGQNLLAGFPDPVALSLPATAPTNTYRDGTATGAGPYFFRVLSDPAAP